METKKSINFIESPEELSLLDMNQIVGGISGSAEAPCSVGCSGSSCNVKGATHENQLMAE